MSPRGGTAARAARAGRTAPARTADVVPGLDGPLDGFLDELRAGRRLSDHTVNAYARDLGDYRAFALRHRLRDWGEAGATFVDAYFALLLKRGLSGATVARRRGPRSSAWPRARCR